MTISTRRLSGAITITLLSLAVTACGGSAPSAAATASPTPAATPAPASVEPSTPTEASPSAAAASPGASLATTGRIEVPDKGFALTLPAGWTRINLGEGDLEAMLEAAGNNSAFAEQYAAQIKAMAASGLSVFALGPDPTKGTTLNVLAVPSMGMSLDLLEQINTAQVKALTGSDVAAERVTLPAGEALHFRYALDQAGAPAGTSVDQYLVLVGDNQLVVSVSNASEAEAKAIAESLEVVN